MAMSFKDALARLENSRVKSTRPLIPPQILQEDLPLWITFHIPNSAAYILTLIRTLLAAQTVLQGRLSTENILKGDDDRLMVVVG